MAFFPELENTSLYPTIVTMALLGLVAWGLRVRGLAAARAGGMHFT